MRPNRATLALAAFALLGFAAAQARAETVYRYRTPEGATVYSDVLSNYRDAPPLGKRVETLEVPPPDSAAAAQERRERFKREAARADRVAAQRVDALDAAADEMRIAWLALHDAKAALRQGLQPRAGERLGVVAGQTRLSDAYWSRVRRLQQAVRDAQGDFDHAMDARNAAR